MMPDEPPAPRASTLPPSAVCFLLQDTGFIHGAQQSTLDLLRALASLEPHAFRVLLIRETRRTDLPDTYSQALIDTGLPVVVLESPGAFSCALVRRIRHEVRDARVLHTVGPKASLHAVLAARKGIRVVSTLHGWLFRPEWKERLHEVVELFALRRMWRVIALTSFYTELLRARGVRRVLHIPGGFDPTPLAAVPPPPADTPFTIGFIGRLSHEKNVPMLLRVAQHFEGRNDIRFLIAGDGPDRAALHEEARRLGVEPLVEWAGHIPRTAFFSRIHALALCSRIENLPFALLEAMALGRPVVATRVGGIPDVIKPGLTGALVDFDDDTAMAAVLKRWIASPDEIARLTTAARDHVHDQFSPQASARAHLALYREACT